MFSVLKNKLTYSTIEDREYDEELKLDGVPQYRSNIVTIKATRVSLLLIVVLFISSIISTWILFFNFKHIVPQITTSVVPSAPSVSCQQPPLRREWRTLTAAEQQNYISAVKCLSTKPSILGHNGTLYDDFPWVHKYTSGNSKYTCDHLAANAPLSDQYFPPTAHKSAPFLPWHRYYLHIYETALKQQCSFKSTLP